MRFFTFFCALAFAAMVATSTNAAITSTISVGSNTGSVTSLPASISLTDNTSNVSFTANFLLTGSSNIFDDVGAIGVDGGATSNIDTGESVTISFVNFTGVSGGTVNFDGFTSINLTGMGAPGEVAQVPPGFTNLITTNGQSNLAGAPLASPLNVVGLSNADFQITGFGAQFTGVTSVPEPGSLATVGLLAIGLISRRRRRP